MTPSQLQKWLELFQVFNTSKGSFFIDSLNLSNAERSVSFPKAEAVLLGWKHSKFEVKRRNKARHDKRNMFEGQKTRLLDCIPKSLILYMGYICNQEVNGGLMDMDDKLSAHSKVSIEVRSK